jgi:glycosyltransferase involved in cell wall biosynthesis
MAKFSIIIPVYNVEKYLDACVESVLGQSFTDFEVLLIDDGATDRSGAMCDDWAAKDGRIRVIHQENQGLSGARNTGSREARGEYLLSLDSDDWWEDSEVLGVVARRLEQTQAQVLSFDYRKSYDGRKTPPYFGKEDAKEFTLEYMMKEGLWVNGICNKAVSRRLFEDNTLNFRPKVSSEDMDWTLRLALKAERFDYLQQVVFVYRQRATSLSHSVSPKRVADMLGNVRYCVKLLEEHPDKKQTLLPYVAYQYATTLYNYAGLSGAHRKALEQEAKALSWLLKESANSKVKLLQTANRWLGFKGMLLALRIRQAI